MRLMVLLAGVGTAVVAGAALAVSVDSRVDSRSGGDCAAAFLAISMEGEDRSTDITKLDERHRVSGKLTNDGRSSDPAFAPDGERVAFASGRGHEWTSEHGAERLSIYVADADGGNQRQLTDGHKDSRPSWSPDGRRIAFLRNRSAVVVVDVASGEEQTPVGMRGLLQVDWLSDDTLAFVAYHPDSLSTRLYRVRVTGGQPAVLVDRVSERIVWNADRTAFARSSTIDETDGSLRVVRIPGGETTVVPDTASESTTPMAWTKSGTLVYTRNLAGPSVAIVERDGIDGTPKRIGEVEKVFLAGQAANPACAL